MPFYALCVLPCVSLDQLPRSSRPHREELQGDAVLWPVVASHRQAATQFQTAERHLIFQQLNSHHSRDPLFLARLRKEMASMNPWRCKYCRRMVRPSSDLCGGCWGRWSVCYDATYVHKRHKKESQHKKRQQYSPEWNDASWEAPWREGDSPWKQSQKASHRGSGRNHPATAARAPISDRAEATIGILQTYPLARVRERAAARKEGKVALQPSDICLHLRNVLHDLLHHS